MENLTDNKINKLGLELQKAGFSAEEAENAILKAWSTDLQKQFPNGSWRTINGARVFLNEGKVVAGLDGFNGMIDDFFKEKKETPKKDSKPEKPEIVKEMESGRWNGKIYGSERNGYSVYLDGDKRELSSDEMKQMNDYTKAMKEFKDKRKKDVQNKIDNLFKKEKMNMEDLKYMSDNIDIFPDKLREIIRSITKDAPPIGFDADVSKLGYNKENSKVTGYKMTRGGIVTVLQNGDDVRLGVMKKLKPVEKIGDMRVTKHFDDSISVSFAYDVALKDKLKEMGAKWNSENRSWDFDKDNVKDFYKEFKEKSSKGEKSKTVKATSTATGRQFDVKVEMVEVETIRGDQVIGTGQFKPKVSILGDIDFGNVSVSKRGDVYKVFGYGQGDDVGKNAVLEIDKVPDFLKEHFEGDDLKRKKEASRVADAKRSQMYDY